MVKYKSNWFQKNICTFRLKFLFAISYHLNNISEILFDFRFHHMLRNLHICMQHATYDIHVNKRGFFLCIFISPLTFGCCNNSRFKSRRSNQFLKLISIIPNSFLDLDENWIWNFWISKSESVLNVQQLKLSIHNIHIVVPN